MEWYWAALILFGLGIGLMIPTLPALVRLRARNSAHSGQSSIVGARK